MATKTFACLLPNSAGTNITVSNTVPVWVFSEGAWHYRRTYDIPNDGSMLRSLALTGGNTTCYLREGVTEPSLVASLQALLTAGWTEVSCQTAITFDSEDGGWPLNFNDTPIVSSVADIIAGVSRTRSATSGGPHSLQGGLITFQLAEPADIGTLTPSSGPRTGGTLVTITSPAGAFDPGDVPVVAVDGAFSDAVDVQVLSAFAITAVMPTTATAGATTVTISDSGGALGTAPFTYTENGSTPDTWAPDSFQTFQTGLNEQGQAAITGQMPSGPRRGGTRCEIVQAGLFDVSDPPTVIFSGAVCPALQVTVIDADTLRFVTPTSPTANLTLVTIADSSGTLGRFGFVYTS